MAQRESGELNRYYRRLLQELGPQGWWAAETRLEVIVGAILTQNTTWRNAALAVRRLREAGLLNVAGLRTTSAARLRSLIRPAGFYRQKARTIQGFVRWLHETHGGSLRRMFRTPADELRATLLAQRGLGPETADAILLYAGGRAFFVSDAYVRRILGRHGLLAENATYAEAQEFIHRRLKRQPQVYNELHALLVAVGKRHCKRRAPDCPNCPLEEFLPSRARLVVQAGSRPQAAAC